MADHLTLVTQGRADDIEDDDEQEDEGLLFEDAYVSNPYDTRAPARPLSNGLLFLVLSLSDWERERIALLNSGYWDKLYGNLAGENDNEDGDSGDEEDVDDNNEGILGTIRSCCRSMSRAVRS